MYHEAYLNKPQAWSQPTTREHELPRAGIAVRPELARSGWFNTMTGMSFRKIVRNRHDKQCKRSVYMGKEEVQERNWLI
jgi:hypothetical protein